jgi:hypothetical protein
MKLHVQVLCDGQWLESKWGGDTMEEAEAAQDALCKNNDSWIGRSKLQSPAERKKQTRIMPKKIGRAL